MKAISLHQPFAYAIVADLKGIETRPRRTNIRGRIAIATVKKDPWASELYSRGWLAAIEISLAQQGDYRRDSLAYGAVIGTVEIVDCVPVEEIRTQLTAKELVLGDYSDGRYAWVLRDPVMFDKPVPARGRQGWWEWNPEVKYG